MFRFWAKLRAVIAKEMTDDVVGVRLGVDAFPLVAWSLGGTVKDNKTGQLIQNFPAKYGLGWIKHEKLPRFPFRCPDHQFGFIVCIPPAKEWASGGEFEMEEGQIIYR
ncbi:hypothetical protein [Rhabdaerophilum sp. SD176]|uniref:hypothetical protein n=1 Tax=Rhabdaerophilum sp. SD176 TaxID=2983548 RepID=UPI0024E02A1F|nr:hypothetical protein [Rhabdaerophilum sp. SD176]